MVKGSDSGYTALGNCMMVVGEETCRWPSRTKGDDWGSCHLPATDRGVSELE